MEAGKVLQSLTANGTAGAVDKEINDLLDTAFADMDDDFNTPKAMASLFEIVSKINGLKAGHISFNELTDSTLERLKKDFNGLVTEVLGLIDETSAGADSQVLDDLMHLIIDIRANARSNKDWGTSDKIRDGLASAKILLKDGKEGTSWGKIN